MSRMIARDQVDAAAAETGCARVYRDENRDQYERDGELITVDYKTNNSIRLSVGRSVVYPTVSHGVFGPLASRAERSYLLRSERPSVPGIDA